jgi:hypothetical protein
MCRLHTGCFTLLLVTACLAIAGCCQPRCEDKAICVFLDKTLTRDLNRLSGDRQVRLAREKVDRADARALVAVERRSEPEVQAIVDWLYGPDPAMSDK